MDDFDMLFPNELDKYPPCAILSILPYTTQKQMSSENEPIYQESYAKHTHNKTNFVQTQSSSDDESLNQESCSNHTNDINLNEEFLHEEPIINYFSKTIAKDVLAVQNGKFNYKKQKFFKESIRKQKKLELLRKRFEFEKEKFRQEIKLKEKQMNSQEKLKIMELEMKERIAMKELQLKEKLKLQE